MDFISFLEKKYDETITSLSAWIQLAARSCDLHFPASTERDAAHVLREGQGQSRSIETANTSARCRCV